jgi:hypothetical protein
MSIDALGWAKRTSFGSPSRKLLMLILADYADEDWSCFPSQVTLAKATDLGERTVRRLLGELEQEGWLRREHRQRPDGSRTSDRLYLQWPQFPTVAEDPPAAPIQPATVADPTGQPRPIQPATVAGHEPPVEPPEDRTTVVSSREQLTLVADPVPAALPVQAHHQAVGQVLGSDRDLAFVEFWRVFPLKVGKGQARRAWATARRRGVLPEVMVAGAHSYAQDPNRDPGYTKHPATWLNGECWDDEPLPTRDMPRSGAARTADAFARYRRPSTTALASALQAALPAGGEP